MIKTRWKKTAALLAGVLLVLCAVTASAETILLDAPLWLQKDERWRDVYLNVDGGEERTIGQAGCTLCCLASAESLRTGKEVTPFEMLFRVEFSGDDLHWPKEYEVLARTKKGMLSRQAAPLLLACLRCGRPALVGLYSKERGSHWVLVHGCQDLEPDDPQLSRFLIRDPGTQGRTTLDQVRTYFPLIRVIRTYEITEELRTAVRAAAES